MIATDHSVLWTEGPAAHGLPIRMLLGLPVVVAIVDPGVAFHHVVKERARNGLRRL